MATHTQQQDTHGEDGHESHLRIYTAIYVGLLLLATGKFVFFEFDVFTYAQAFAGVMGIAIGKTILIAGWYQHLKDEPRSLTYLMILSLVLVVLLGMAATLSIS